MMRWASTDARHTRDDPADLQHLIERLTQWRDLMAREGLPVDEIDAVLRKLRRGLKWVLPKAS